MTVNHLSPDSPGALPGVATIQVPLSSFRPRGCDSLSYNQVNGKGSKISNFPGMVKLAVHRGLKIPRLVYGVQVRVQLPGPICA